MTETPLVRLDSLWKTFHKYGKTINVLRGLSLDVYAGDTIAVVGKSGSGKSTFLHILGTLEQPTKGDFFFAGTNTRSMRLSQIDQIRNQHIGFIFQFHHLLPDQNALQNVLLPMLIAGESDVKAQSRARHLLEKVGLSDRILHKPGELSGGEQQRVAIARAMVYHPKLLLADEPTGNLDPNTAADIMNLLFSLREESGGALILVTHDHKLAQLCQRQLQLQNGVFTEGEL